MKGLKKLGIEKTYLNIIKTIHAKPITNIIINRKKLNHFLYNQE
jgi:hypothetical protein